MRKRTVMVFALVLVCEAILPLVADAQSAGPASASSRQTARVISALLRKYPAGGHGMVVAIEHMVESDPASTPAIVAAASDINPERKAALEQGDPNSTPTIVEAASRMNPDQKAALEQGIALAVGRLGKCDAKGHCGSAAAQEIQDYLEANTSDPIVLAILTDEIALGAIGNQDGGDLSGAGGGGFSGGAGPAISPS